VNGGRALRPPMNEALCLFGVFIVLLCVRPRLRKEDFQAVLHKEFPDYAPLLQYHSLVYGMLLVFLLWCCLKMLLNDLAVFQGPEVVENVLNKTLEAAPELTRSDRRDWYLELQISPGLLACSANAPIAVLFTVMLSGAHIRTLVLESARSPCDLQWLPSSKQDKILQILLLPAVYAVLVLQSVVRAWAAMVGHGWSEWLLRSGLDWADAVQVHMEHYKANLAVANFVEMYTLICFSTLCLASLSEAQALDTLQRPFRNLLMHGLYGFVLVGFCKIACELWICAIVDNQGVEGAYDLKPFRITWIAGADHDSGIPGFFAGTIVWDATLLQMLDAALHIILVFASLQGLHCIIRVCAIPELAEANARWKFLGTEVLILVAQLQYAVLDIVAMYDSSIITLYQAKLWHASLLSYECFIVSVLHWRHWAPEDYCQASELNGSQVLPGDQGSTYSSERPITSSGGVKSSVDNLARASPLLGAMSPSISIRRPSNSPRAVPTGTQAGGGNGTGSLMIPALSSRTNRFCTNSMTSVTGKVPQPPSLPSRLRPPITPQARSQSKTPT